MISCGGCTKLGIGFTACALRHRARPLTHEPRSRLRSARPHTGSRAGCTNRVCCEFLRNKINFFPLQFHSPIARPLAALLRQIPVHHCAISTAECAILPRDGICHRRGRDLKGGGRVVKNVTGYSLHKLLIGSLGTLAVITRVNFRTFPLPPAQGTFVASFSMLNPLSASAAASRNRF